MTKEIIVNLDRFNEYYDANKWFISPSSRRAVRSIFEELGKWKGGTFEVEISTDESTGTADIEIEIQCNTKRYRVRRWLSIEREARQYLTYYGEEAVDRIAQLEVELERLSYKHAKAICTLVTFPEALEGIRFDYTLECNGLLSHVKARFFDGSTIIEYKQS